MANALGDEPWKVEEMETRKHFASRLTEIPAPLSAREIVAHEEGQAFWVDSFRGYNDGFSFDTSYRWSISQDEEADPDDWPDLTATSATGTHVTIEVSVDGRARTNTSHGFGVLHAAGSSATPGISSATWWVPEIPEESVTVSFLDTSAGFSGSVDIAAAGWRSAIRQLSLSI